MIHPSGGQLAGAGILAVLVHGVFIAGLVVSLTWRSLPQTPAFADLWTELPPPPQAPAPPPELPASPPEPAPPPPVTQTRADIELKVKEEARRRKEAERREQARREALAREQEERRRREEEAERERLHQEEARRQELERQRQEALAREQAARELEAELKRQLQEDLAREMRQLQRGTRSQAEAAARLRMMEEYQARIRSKIHQNLRLPPNLSGNPEVIYQVKLLPDGEILRLTLIKGSGQPAYDRQVEVAILQSSPLPLPPDLELAALFREELILKFRPHDG